MPREEVGATQGKVLAGTGQQGDPQQSGSDPGENEDQGEVAEDLGNVEAEEVRDQFLEDSVSGDEERAEDEQERSREEHAPRRG